jgi:hypothetical protein
MSADTEERKLAAIMFTDMIGYIALSQRNAIEILARVAAQMGARAQHRCFRKTPVNVWPGCAR